VNKKDKSDEEEEKDAGFEEEGSMPICSWVKKLELSSFEGNYPLRWFAGAENYLKYNE